MSKKPMTTDREQLRRVQSARPCVLETLNPATMTVSYWPGIRFADGKEAMVSEDGKPKARKTWSGASNAAYRLVQGMRERATAALGALAARPRA